MTKRACAEMPDGRLVGQVNVRASGEVAARVGRALGLVLPVEPNTVSTSGERSALWLGPDEWLVVDGLTRVGGIEAVVRQAFTPDWGSVVDVSANRSVVELSGPHARALLAKGCSLDLHPQLSTWHVCPDAAGQNGRHSVADR
jgi:sarcosine oxidase subunit gamma